MYMD